MPSSADTPVPLIEPQSALNVRLGRRTGGLDMDVLQCRRKYTDGPEKGPEYAFRDPEITFFFCGAGTVPFPNSSRNGEGDICTVPCRLFSCIVAHLFSFIHLL